jgi:hypothetical protein
MKKFLNRAREGFYAKQGLLSTALVLSPFAAMAQDPSSDIVAQINVGKGYGIAAATAMVIAVWAITSVYMAKRKG